MSILYVYELLKYVVLHTQGVVWILRSSHCLNLDAEHTMFLFIGLHRLALFLLSWHSNFLGSFTNSVKRKLEVRFQCDMH